MAVSLPASSNGIHWSDVHRHNLHIDKRAEVVDEGREWVPWRLLATMEACDVAERCDGFPGSWRVGDGADGTSRPRGQP